MNNKASLTEIIGLFITAFVIIVAVIAFGIAHKETSDGFEQFRLEQDDALINQSTQPLMDQATKYPVFWDFLIVFLIFGLWLGIIISSWLLGNNPIFLIFYIVGSVANIVLAIVWEFALQDFAGGVATYMVDYPITLFMINHWFIFSLFFIITTGIALFMKPGGYSE